MIMSRSDVYVPLYIKGLAFLILVSINIVTSSCTSNPPIVEDASAGAASAMPNRDLDQRSTASDALTRDTAECKNRSEASFPSSASRAGKAFGGLALGIIFPQAGGMLMSDAIFEDHSEAKKNVFISCMKSRGHPIEEPQSKGSPEITQ